MPRSVFVQENTQKGKYELVITTETPSQFQLPLPLSDLVLSLPWRCDESDREVTKVAGFSPLLLLPLPLLFRGDSCRPGSQPTSFIVTKD